MINIRLQKLVTEENHNDKIIIPSKIRKLNPIVLINFETSIIQEGIREAITLFKFHTIIDKCNMTFQYTLLRYLAINILY